MTSRRVVAVVPAAGRGERMGAGENKVFLPLGDRPVLAHTLGLLEACPLVDEVVLAVGPGEEGRCRREVLEPFELRKTTGVIRGGASRQESVALALRFIGPAADAVAIHDGARPLLPAELLVAAIELGLERGAVIVGLPARDTVKRAAPARGPAAAPGGGRATSGARATARVTETIDRRGLWQVQTPQVFWRDLAELAYRRAAEAGASATDDASLVERLKHPVLILEGSEENLKITSPLDLVLARAILDWRGRRRR